MKCEQLDWQNSKEAIATISFIDDEDGKEVILKGLVVVEE